jgi:Ca-activated chloride channel family protein
MSPVKFATPAWLAAIAVLLPTAWLLLRWSARRRRASLDRVVAPRLHDLLVRSVDHRKRSAKTILFVAALAWLLAALARPLVGLREVQVERAGVDVILALDVSRSMLAEDAPPSRLTTAKAALGRLLELPSRDRYGLIIFSGESFLMAPVTQDHGAVQRSLQSVSTSSASKAGTDLAAAIDLAIRSYDETLNQGKALILITDGEQLQGDAVLAARRAAARGVTVFATGVGTTRGARVPERPGSFGRYLKNEFNNEVVSRLNEQMLQQVAGAGHGFYRALGEEGQGLLSLVETGVAPLARATQVRRSKESREYFQWPLGLAVALLLGELLLSERKRAVPLNGPGVSPGV